MSSRRNIRVGRAGPGCNIPSAELVNGQGIAIATHEQINGIGVMLTRRLWWLSLLTLVCLTSAVPLSAQTESGADQEPPVDILETLNDYSCKDLKQIFYRQIPRYVYDDQSDQLYELVLFLDENCDFGEPLGRVQILASIWDGNFQEVIYGFGVIDWLAERYDVRNQAKVGSEREAFDLFTVEFASQMLPHVPARSLEEFFCLFYTGQSDAAWALLQSDDLEDTWLRYYYEEEIGILTQMENPYLIGVHGGGWWPADDLEFVGPKTLVGLTVEQWFAGWFVGGVLEGRIGRATEPYFVDEAGIRGRSDRWNAVLIGIEAGHSLWRSGPHLATAFLGLGYDVLTPFQDEEIALGGVNFNLGLGYRYHVGRDRRWFVNAVGRYELIGERNEGGTNLGGSALSARLGLGMSLGGNPEPRLETLGYRIQPGYHPQ